MSEPVVVRGDDAWTAAIEVVEHAITEAQEKWGATLTYRSAEAALSALFAPTRTPCPQCEGRGDYPRFTRQVCSMCHRCGFVEGPSLADGIYGAEEVGWDSLEADGAVTFYTPTGTAIPGDEIGPVFTLARLPREETQ